MVIVCFICFDYYCFMKDRFYVCCIKILIEFVCMYVCVINYDWLIMNELKYILFCVNFLFFEDFKSFDFIDKV